MPNAKFYLNRNSIILRLYHPHPDSPFTYFTGIKVSDPSQWSGNKQKLKSISKSKESQARTSKDNEELQSIKNHIESIYKQLAEYEKKKITNDLLNERLELAIDNIEVTSVDDQKKSFWDAFDEFERTAPMRESALGNYLAPRTIQSITTLGNHLRCFSKMRYIKLSWESITPVTYDKLKEYLHVDEGEIELKYQNAQGEQVKVKFKKVRLNSNSVAKTIKKMKTFLNWSIDRGYFDNVRIVRQFKGAEKYRSENVYLTITELKLMNCMPLTDTRDNLSRDYFNFMVNTGFRIHTAIAMKKQDFDPVTGIGKVYVGKSKKDQQFYLNEEARRILSRHENSRSAFALPRIPEQKINLALKRIAKNALLTPGSGFDRSIQKIEEVWSPIANKVMALTSVHQLSEVISNHTARKTTYNLLQSLGQPYEIINIICGHRPKQVQDHYYNYSEQIKIALDKLSDKIALTPGEYGAGLRLFS